MREGVGETDGETDKGDTDRKEIDRNAGQRQRQRAAEEGGGGESKAFCFLLHVG